MLSSPTESLTNDAQTANVQTTRNLLLLLILFAGSGCSALIYEIVWYQLLQLRSVRPPSRWPFCWPLSWAACAWAAWPCHASGLRRHHPLRVYAAHGSCDRHLCAIVVLFEVPLITAFTWPAGHGLRRVLLRAFISAICLLPPTVLMGASLPAMSGWLEVDPARDFLVGSAIRQPTPPGAVFGCLLAGFYLLRVYDMRMATFVAAAINVAVAADQFWLSGHIRSRLHGRRHAPQPGPAGPTRRATAGRYTSSDRIIGRQRPGRRGGLDAPAGMHDGRDGLCLLHHPGRIPDRPRHRQRGRVVALAHHRPAKGSRAVARFCSPQPSPGPPS